MYMYMYRDREWLVWEEVHWKQETAEEDWSNNGSLQTVEVYSSNDGKTSEVRMAPALYNIMVKGKTEC